MEWVINEPSAEVDSVYHSLITRPSGWEPDTLTIDHDKRTLTLVYTAKQDAVANKSKPTSLALVRQRGLEDEDWVIVVKYATNKRTKQVRLSTTGGGGSGDRTFKGLNTGKGIWAGVSRTTFKAKVK